MQSNTFIKMLHSFCAPITDEQLGTIIVGEVIFKVMFRLRTKTFDCQQNLWEKKAKIKQKNSMGSKLQINEKFKDGTDELPITINE